MTTNPPILALILFTCNRLTYARRTLRATLNGLHYSGPMKVHIADDGSLDGHREELVALAAGYPQVTAIGATNAEGRGYGASFNLATQAAHPGTALCLCLEDDWELRQPLDLDPLAAVLLGEPASGVGCIRLGYLGYTAPLRGELAYLAGAHYLLLDPASPEHHVFAGHPRLETVAWERSVGPWPEGLDAGTTERYVAGRPEARHGVAWPLDLVPPRGGLFAHIGTVQARTDQRAAEPAPAEEAAHV